VFRVCAFYPGVEVAPLFGGFEDLRFDSMGIEILLERSDRPHFVSRRVDAFVPNHLLEQFLYLLQTLLFGHSRYLLIPR